MDFRKRLTLSHFKTDTDENYRMDLETLFPNIQKLFILGLQKGINQMGDSTFGFYMCRKMMLLGIFCKNIFILVLISIS